MEREWIQKKKDIVNKLSVIDWETNSLILPKLKAIKLCLILKHMFRIKKKWIMHFYQMVQNS